MYFYILYIHFFYSRVLYARESLVARLGISPEYVQAQRRIFFLLLSPAAIFFIFSFFHFHIPTGQWTKCFFSDATILAVCNTHTYTIIYLFLFYFFSSLPSFIPNTTISTCRLSGLNEILFIPKKAMKLILRPFQFYLFFFFV